MATISNGESGSSVRTKLNDIINKVEGVTSINNNIDITGTLTSDGLTVSNTGTGSTISVERTDGSVFSLTAGTYSILGTDDATNLYLKTNGTFRQLINSGGDISFYEDTGTTPKFFWDASAEALGIGTDSPSAVLHAINSASSGESIAILEAAAEKNGYVYINADDDRRKSLVFQSGGVNKFSMGVGDSDELSADSFFIGSGLHGGSGADLVIDSSGNVGIGTSSPAREIHSHQSSGGSTNYAIFTNTTTGSTSSDGVIVGLNATSDGYFWNYEAGNLVFGTNATERMRIDSSGNLLIAGTGTPTSSVGNLVLYNGTAPTGNATDGVILYAEDVSSSSELKVRDEAGNVTTLSPHNFDLIPEGPSEDMAWSYYSERDGKRINVDMLKAVRLLEQLTGEKLVHIV